ncbi:MAG: hypothetical protein NTY35_03820 [Planctomycetota bacterium]|nr:hypothetical protein [Planctomycetota bacterium]
MNFLPTALAALALLLAAPTLPQSGGDKPPRPPAAPEKPASVEQILGAWRLTDFESPTIRREKRDEVGYLLVTDSFLSFECHMGWLDDAGRRQGSTFFSGTHEYELRADSVLVMTQLIGATVDPNGSTPVFEPTGRKRGYKVKFDGAKLVLTRESDGQTFKFERLGPSGGGLDFYGRRKAPAKPEAPPKDGEKQ